MAELHDDLVQRFSTPDIDSLEDFYRYFDMSPTLDRWVSHEADREDMALVLTTMAAAYDAGVHARERHERGDPNAMDLPIGAALIDPDTGYIYSAFAQDCERGVDSDHAEVMLIRKAQACEVDLTKVTLGVTVECCPTCIEAVEAAGIPRVVYGASRRDLEAVGLIKEHDLQGPDIVVAGRTEHNKYHFEFLKLPDREFQEACLELLMGFERTYETRRSVLTPGSHSINLRSRTFRNFVNDIARGPQVVNEDGSVMERPPVEPADVLLGAFQKMFSHRG